MKEAEKRDDLLITYWTWAAPFLTLPWEMGEGVAHETVLTVRCHFQGLVRGQEPTGSLQPHMKAAVPKEAVR